MPTVSAISRTLNRRSANTRSWIFFTLSSVLTNFGAPGRGSSKTETLKLVKPIFDDRHRRRRVTLHSIQALFDFAARFPFQKQESNHRRILFFSIFVKSADTRVSTRCQNKTTSPIRLKFWQELPSTRYTMVYISCDSLRVVRISTYRTALVHGS